MTQPITVIAGPFAGFSGKLLREAGDNVFVELVVFGRTTEVQVARSDLWSGTATLDELEGEVIEAVGRRGAFRMRLFALLQEEAQRSPPRTEAEVAAQYDALEAELRLEQDAVEAATLTRFRAAFQALDDSARNQKWLAERATWTDWREEARAAMEPTEAALLGKLEGEARDAEKRRLYEAAGELRERLDAWRRKQESLAAPGPEPRNEELERAIERDIDRDEPFLVYADWLQSQGNRRGELIALQASGAKRKVAAQALLVRLVAQLLGGLAHFAPRLEAQWRLGFLESLKIEATRADEGDGFNVVKLLETALQLPSARFLRELEVACPSVHEQELPSLEAVFGARGPRPTLRALSLSSNEDEEMLSWTCAGELSGYASVFPNLKTLRVHAGDFSLTAPKFPRLQTLVLQTCGMKEASLAAIIEADWPALEQLELWFGRASYGVKMNVEHVRPLLHSTRLPRLTSLALCNCEFTDELCAAVLASPLLPALKSLSLAKGTMTEAGAQALIAGASQLRGLQTLDVDDNYLPPALLEELQAVLPQTRSDEQRTAEEEEGVLHRYASVGE